MKKHLKIHHHKPESYNEGFFIKLIVEYGILKYLEESTEGNSLKSFVTFVNYTARLTGASEDLTVDCIDDNVISINRTVGDTFAIITDRPLPDNVRFPLISNNLKY